VPQRSVATNHAKLSSWLFCWYLETALNLRDGDTAVKILVVDENPIRRAILEEGLKEAGYSNVVVLASTLRLVDHIYRLDPDVILMDLENPSRDELDQMFQVSRIVRRPIAMFVDQSERSTISAAVDAGVSAYIVDGLKKERVSAILEMTVSRFRAFDKLRSELDEAKSALKDRKVIDRAKGFLMKSKGLDEDAAYKRLRQTAMRQSRKIADVAESLLSAIDLLDTPGGDE
jgi:two-component system, response regulator / RNA-binding antiterminator